MADHEHIARLKESAESWNKWREDNPEIIPDLHGANLYKINLINANLSHADLSGAVITDAILSRVNASMANLQESILCGTKIYNSNFSASNMIDADISQANLYLTNFSNTIFRCAKLKETLISVCNFTQSDFTGALFKGTVLKRAGFISANFSEVYFDEVLLGDLNLQDVISLEDVKHFGPSHLATTTIYRSRGQIPRKFLKGCGLDDIFIDYIPDLIAAAKPIQFYSCFISYSSADKAFAQKLHQDLTDTKVRCWLDSENLKPGDRLRPTITEAIRCHDKLLLIISPESATSDWVEDEVEEALAQEKRNDDGTRIDKLFPIRIASFDDLPDEPWLNALKRKRHIGDFSACNDEAAYQKALDRLLRDLNASAELEEAGKKNENGITTHSANQFLKP